MYEEKDELVFMQEDLKRALKTPNPPGIRYRPMYEIEKGTDPHVRPSIQPGIVTFANDYGH